MITKKIEYIISARLSEKMEQRKCNQDNRGKQKQQNTRDKAKT